MWWVLPPGLAIALTVLAFAVLGHAFEERARPSLRSRERVRRQPAALRLVAHAGGPPLAIDGLHVTYPGAEPVHAVDGVDLEVGAGELVGLVGESGSGKSTVAAAAIGMLPPGTTTAGAVRIEGRDLATMPAEQLRRLRGDRVALVPQEAMSALNPVHTIEDQLVEAVRVHRPVGRAAARKRAAELLELVGIDPRRGRDHPHQFSGGMRQRVVIAMALANDPAVLIADEPTTGLDVLVQAEVLDLLDGLRRRLGLALLVVTHDLPMIERIADRIAVMHAGRLVEVGPAARVVGAPEHPYTRLLVESAARLQPEVAR
jgi:ABC-type glutathione transport system ATPase component